MQCVGLASEYITRVFLYVTLDVLISSTGTNLLNIYKFFKKYI